MKISKLDDLLNNITNTDATSYSDADKHQDLSVAGKYFLGIMLESMTDWNITGDTATDDLVANQREYDFPTNFIKLKRLDLKLDGTNWYRATYIDEGEISDSIASESDITEQFTNTEPYYTFRGNKIFILSGTIKDVTDGIKYTFAEMIVGRDSSGSDLTDFSDDNDEPIIPEPYQIGLVYYAAKLWFQKYGMTDRAREMDIEVEKVIARMRQYRITDEKMMLKPASTLENYE